MNFDVFTTAAIVDELSRQILGGRVQDSLEIGEHALGLEIYANRTRHYLLISAHPQEARVHLTPERMRRGVEQPSPLGLMLRRNIEGAGLIAIQQPSWERVIQFGFEGAEGLFSLIVEPMERRSNILLVRDGIIMDCLRRVGADENRVRVSLPGHKYVPPPRQLHKLPPNELRLELVQAILEAEPDKAAWRGLTDNILGFSPMLAKEAVYRAMQSANIKAGDASATDLYSAAHELLVPLLAHQWQPGVTQVDGIVTSYATYPISHLPGWERAESISMALDRFYGAHIGIEAYNAAKMPVEAMLTEARERVEKRLAALHRAERDESERDRLRQSGELILAYQHQIAPGQPSLSAQYDFDIPALDIKLDPALSALDNAKNYFEQYEKAKRATAEVPALLRTAQGEVDYLLQLETDLALASNFPEIGEVQDALQASGYWRGPHSARPKTAKTGPLKVTTSEGMIIYIGRNARQNEEVTFGKGKPEDLWLHAHGFPGAHVIIKSEGKTVPASVIQQAASLAAYYSGARSEGHVLVDVTERRHVRKIKGGKPGMVTIRNESPVNVVPAAPKSTSAI